jgi:transposase
LPKAYSLDLRERVARFVEAGRSSHAAAAHFCVSVSFAVRLNRHPEMAQLDFDAGDTSQAVPRFQVITYVCETQNYHEGRPLMSKTHFAT